MSNLSEKKYKYFKVYTRTRRNTFYCHYIRNGISFTNPFFSNGYYGVDVFFVLSGYLITTILQDEYKLSNNINIIIFYKKRLLRLYPALILFLLVIILIWPLFYQTKQQAWTEIIISAIYISDYSISISNTPTILSHTWSLSVEEHFYLLLPILLIFVFKNEHKSQIFIILSLFIISTIWRILNTLGNAEWNEIYYRFDFRLSGLLLGSLLAIWQPHPPRAAGIIGLIAIAISMAFSAWGNKQSLLIWITLTEFGAAAIISTASQWHFLSTTPLVWIGRLSYGLYLWHYPVMRWCRANEWNWQSTILLGSAVALIAAIISYYSVEKWARKYREKFIPKITFITKKNPAISDGVHKS